MRLLEIDQQYTLYVDMDGVLCDFEGGFEKLVGGPITSETKKQFWKTLKGMTEEEHVNYWANLDWTSQGKQLWSSVANFSPTILSSPGTSMRQIVEAGKRKWINKHLNPQPSSVIFETSKEKYADKSSILIDDREKVLNPWLAAGGIGILHKDGQLDNTIAQLNEYF